MIAIVRVVAAALRRPAAPGPLPSGPAPPCAAAVIIRLGLALPVDALPSTIAMIGSSPVTPTGITPDPQPQTRIRAHLHVTDLVRRRHRAIGLVTEDPQLSRLPQSQRDCGRRGVARAHTPLTMIQMYQVLMFTSEIGTPILGLEAAPHEVSSGGGLVQHQPISQKTSLTPRPQSKFEDRTPPTPIFIKRCYTLFLHSHRAFLGSHFASDRKSTRLNSSHWE